jgi:hypothetical protein
MKTNAAPDYETLHRQYVQAYATLRFIATYKQGPATLADPQRLVAGFIHLANQGLGATERIGDISP